MKNPLMGTLFITAALTLTSCGSSSSSYEYPDDLVSEDSSSDTQQSSDFSPGNLFSRLNASGSDTWIEDVSVDMTGSDSLAVYLTPGSDGCAIWVFDNEGIARYNLEEGILDFPGAVFVGADTESNLGIIFIAPEDNSPCTYNTSEVLGWGY